MTRPSLTISFPTETDVPAVPLDEHRRDEAGRPIDPERYQRLLEREHAERERERYVVERYPSFADDKTMLCVMDRQTGKMLGGQILPTSTITEDDADYILARVKRDLPQPIRPDLKLCG